MGRCLSQQGVAITLVLGVLSVPLLLMLLLPLLGKFVAATQDATETISSDTTAATTPATTMTTAAETERLINTSTKAANPCDHKRVCSSELVCGCYYYYKQYSKRRECRKMFDCTHENLTIESIRNINFADVNDTIFDVKFNGYKLRVKDIDDIILFFKNTGKSGFLIFGPLEKLPCITKTLVNFVKKFPFTVIDHLTNVFCNNTNLKDKDIDNISFPKLTKRLYLEHNKLKKSSRLPKILDSLPYLENVDLSYNNLTTIPKINATRSRTTPSFILNLNNNNITRYDSEIIAQFASPDDKISIHMANNSFICDCEAYRTNEVMVQHGTNFVEPEGLCSVLDENTGKEILRRIPRKVEEYWKNKCESSSGYLYLIFTWQNFLDTFLIIGNLFFIYIIYDLLMAIRESKQQRSDTKNAKSDRRDSIKSSRSNRRSSRKESVVSVSMRKISTFSRKGSKPESEISRVDAHPPRRPLFDVIVCGINLGYKSVNAFIHARVSKKKVVVEEDRRSLIEWSEHNNFRDLKLENIGSLQSLQVFDTRL